MANYSQEKKRAANPKIQAILKQYGLTGSLSVRNYSKVVLTIRRGSINFDALVAHDSMHRIQSNAGTYYEFTSPPDNRRLEGIVYDLIISLYTALNSDNYDNSDVMTDYFDVGWYSLITIGTYNTPYKLTPAKN